MRPQMPDPEHTTDHRATVSYRAAAGFPPPGPAAPAALAAAARAGMAAEWDRGNPVPAEWFFAQAPALAADPSAALDLVFLEYVLREEAGEGPAADGFVARFPQLEPQLRRLLDLDSALGNRAPTATHHPTVGASSSAPIVLSETPASIGRYLVVDAIGVGGQAEVFLGVHPGLGREVVIKRLKRGPGPQLAAEGRVLAGLDHPNLARVYDLDAADGRAFLVMESIRGRNLAEVRKHGPVR